MTAPGDNMAAEGGGYPEPCEVGEQGCTGTAEHRLPVSHYRSGYTCDDCARAMAAEAFADFVGAECWLDDEDGGRPWWEAA